MALFYVETFRPAYPQTGLQYRVHSGQQFSRDALNPCMTAVFEVDCVRSKPEALAAVIEHAAGHGVKVCRIFGGKGELTPASALGAIARRLDRRQWDADAISDVAEILRKTGRPVRDVDPTCVLCETGDEPNHEH